MKDFLKDIREPNYVSNYIFHDQDSFCSLILYAARSHFVDRKSKTTIEGETIYEGFSNKNNYYYEWYLYTYDFNCITMILIFIH